MVQPLWITVWRFLKILKLELTYDPAVPLLGVYLERTLIQKDTCAPLFVPRLSTTARTCDSDSCQSYLTLYDPMDCSPPGPSVLARDNSSGKNTRLGCHSSLQGIFLTQGSNPGLPYCRGILYHLSHQGSQDKEPACSAGDQGAIPGSGRSSGEGNGSRLQYPYLENPMDGGA